MKNFEKYVGLPYKHLGNNIEIGIDCFNLCKLVLKEHKNFDIPYYSHDWCNIIDEDWYSKTHNQFFLDAAKEQHGWKNIEIPEPYDIILMSLGSTNVVNHCSLYIGSNKMLQTMINHKSWISIYGNYYKQYTVGVIRWIGLRD